MGTFPQASGVKSCGLFTHQSIEALYFISVSVNAQTLSGKYGEVLCYLLCVPCQGPLTTSCTVIPMFACGGSQPLEYSHNAMTLIPISYALDPRLVSDGKSEATQNQTPLHCEGGPLALGWLVKDDSAAPRVPPNIRLDVGGNKA